MVRRMGPAEAAEIAEAAEAAGAGGTGSCEGSQACCCHHKETPRTAEFQADLKKRLNRAIGQLNGAAAESAVHNVSALLLQDHLETCVVEQVQRGNTEVIDEAMQLIKRFAR